MVDTLEQVKIPKGVQNETILTLEKKGHAGDLSTTRPGDIFIKIIVDDDKEFKREKNDLIYNREISLKDAIFGSEIEVPTLSSNNKKIKIKPGSQSSSEVIFKEEGFSFVEKDITKKGDYRIIINVKIPSFTNLNSKDKEELNQILDRI